MTADSSFQRASASPQPHPSENHQEPEPDLRQEPDLPSDGPDEEGEAMIRNLPEKPELSKIASHPEVSKVEPRPELKE